MRAATFVLPLVILAASVARADEPNAADRETARIAFAEGNKLRDDGNVRGALEKYRAAFALAPTPVTALEVGRAESDLGHLVEAREALLRVDAMPAHNESPKAQAARAEAASLASKLALRIPKLAIRVAGPAESVTVSVDGVNVPRDALTVARVVNPGRHAVLALAFGHTVQQTIDVREGETRDVTLDVTSLVPRGGISVSPTSMQPLPQQLGVASGASGLVAFNTPDDGHAWALKDPSGHAVCKLPCTQSLGFASGFTVVRDDGEKVTIPLGLAALPGSGAQVTPSGSAGSPAVGWIIIGVGTAAAIASIPAILVDNGNGGGLAAFLVLLLGGTVAITVGTYVVALSHGPMLVRTDMGMPMRIAHQKPTFHITPAGVFGTF